MIATEIVDNRTKTASTVVTVTVTNVNDNFPLFEKTEYFVNISENAMISSDVGVVSTIACISFLLLNGLSGKSRR